MNDLSDIPDVDLMSQWLLFGGIAILNIVISFYLPRLIDFSIARFFNSQIKEIYHQVISGYQNWLRLLLLLILSDALLLLDSISEWLKFIEIGLSLSISVIIIWLGANLFEKFFNIYLLEIALQSNRKLNSELLILAKFIANSSIIIIVIFLFAQTHHINILGLLASLGIGGLAVAFAAQKTLEQFLGGIVIYLDRPFVVDDYIGLPDGTFGRVESIGLRSTKIRTSGKGTLVIVPNNSLTQTNIENFTGAKKIVSLIYLTFYHSLPEEEKALIRQVILASTNDIFGLDFRSTEVNFKDIIKNDKTICTQAQISLFILGSGEVSMDLRRQLIDIAKQNINQQLKDYGIEFEVQDKTINVDSPITI